MRYTWYVISDTCILDSYKITLGTGHIDPTRIVNDCSQLVMCTFVYTASRWGMVVREGACEVWQARAC